MPGRPFPREWFTPTPEARRAAAAIAEGFCPFGEGSRCPVCEVTWALTASGVTRSVTVYPFSGWQQRPVIGLEYEGW